MKIQAIFDDVDSAEHALFQLRSMGAEPKGYSISRLDAVNGRGIGTAFPLNGAFGYDSVSGVGAYTGLMGGVWNSAGWNNGTSLDELSANQFNDGISREVRLTVECSEDEAKRLQGALVSMHGRQVKKAT